MPVPRFDRLRLLRWTNPANALGKEALTSEKTAKPSASPLSQSQPQARSGLGNIKSRATRLIDTQKIPHEPSLRYEGDWAKKAAPQIHADWNDTQAGRDGSSISVLALSKMRALEYERKHLHLMHHEECLLGDSSCGFLKKDDYYKAQIYAFLDAVGEKDPDAVIASFGKSDMGGMHRQHATFTALFGSLLSAISLFVPDIAVKTGLSAARFVWQMLGCKTILEVGKRRFRNAGTEDILWDGRADAAPRAKEASNVLHASLSVLGNLWGVEKTVGKMQKALAAFQVAPDCPKTKQKLQVAFGKFCYRLDVKLDYKAASESAKIELFGNKWHFCTSYTGTLLTLAASLMSIATPMALSGVVTGGFSMAAVATAAALYIGYHLSSLPSKDGAAKAKRAIVAFSKSADVLVSDNPDAVHDRAMVEKTYLNRRKKARWMPPAARAEAIAFAKAERLAELQRIDAQDPCESSMNARENWEAYKQYEIRKKNIEKNSACEKSRDREVAALQAKFEKEHAPDFRTDVAAATWKQPLRIRMENAQRLLKGKVAQAHKQLLKIDPTSSDQAPKRHAAEQALKKSLLNLFNFEIGLQQKQDASTPHALSAIDDADVQALFCGDGFQQVEALRKAKALTAGEIERYTYSNAGSMALGMVTSVAVPTADLGLNAAKVEGIDTGIHYANYKLPNSVQAMGPPNVHQSAGERASFQERQIKRLRELLTPKRDAINVGANLPHQSLTPCLDAKDPQVDAALNDLLDQLRQSKDVPEAVSLTLGTNNISAALNATAAYYRAQYKNASLKKKAAVVKQQVKILGGHAVMSLVGLPIQSIAQLPLALSHKSFKQAEETSNDVRSALKRAHTPQPDVKRPPFTKDPAGAWAEDLDNRFNKIACIS